jgi:adenosylmethionine---8-amino-7-oxononanoate aminotransferase
VIARNRELAAHLGRRAAELADLPHVAEVRQAGMIVAAELGRDGDRRRPFDWQERRGLRVYRHGLQHEALLRPIGNVVYFMPPYVITPEQIDRLVATARDGIRQATCD